jgi:P27 family predicted phage terminase small subunit
MGRPEKSEHEHFVAGTKSTAKSHTTESHVPAGRPRIPSDLGKGLRRIFKDLCRLLSERRALSKGDVELVRLYCFVYDRHKRNVALLQDEGEVVTYYRLNSNGESVPQVRENIRLKLVSGCEKQMASILSQLGMTPTSKDRARPVTGSKQKEEYAEGTIGWLQEHGELDRPNNVVVIAPPGAEEDLQ